MTQYVARANGFNLPFKDHSWSVTAGFVAPVQRWIMPAQKALDIMQSLRGRVGADREITLEFGDPSDTVIVKRVYVLGTAPADNTQRLYLLLTDVRFYFARMIMLYDLNVRRRIGETRLVGANMSPGGLGLGGVIADSVAYGSWSIKNGAAYTWETSKTDVLDNLTLGRHGRPQLEYITDPISLNISPQVIQETINDGDGTSGLARAIEAFPGAGIYVDLNGVIHVYDATPGAEAAMVTALPNDLWRHGSLKEVDNSGQRASRYRAYFDLAIEVRMDFKPKKTISASLDAALQVTQIENVLQVTDLKLDIPAGAWGPARTVGQGTWITLDEAYAAWGGKSWSDYDLPQLTDEIVAQHWLGDTLWRYASGGALGQQDSIWASRIAEVMKCWRTYFRVNSSFWDKVRHIWNVRASVWDPVTGTRAPSPVFTHFHYWNLDNWVVSQIDIYGHDVTDSYDAASGLVANGRPSGFEVTILDPELLVFRIDRDPKRFPGHNHLIPSPVATAATTDGEANGLAEARLQDMVLEDVWPMSVILTCSPASPNDIRRCYEVIVETGDLWSKFGLLDQPCDAPDQEMRSQIAEARVGWQEENEIHAAIVTTFGGPVGSITDADPITLLKPVNLAQELIPAAQALAISDLLPRLDCYQGRLAVPMNADLVPIGSVSSVTHKVTKNRAVSVIDAPEPSIEFDAANFLRGSARSYLLKQIQAVR